MKSIVIITVVSILSISATLFNSNTELSLKENIIENSGEIIQYGKIAGITDEKYYVAESLWAGSGYFGTIIRAYEHDKLTDNFYWHINMDEFYGEDGNYTAYWK